MNLTASAVQNIARDLNDRGARAMAGDDGSAKSVELMLASLTDDDYKSVYKEMRRHNHDLHLGRSPEGFPVVTFRPSVTDRVAAFFKGDSVRKVSMTLTGHSSPDICRRYNSNLKMVTGRFCYR